jgi:N-acetylmuramoyl-L-alanine amidase
MVIMKIITTLLTLSIFSLSALATDDGVAEYKSGKLNPAFEVKSKVFLNEKALSLSSDEIYEKTQAVWNHFQVSPEEANTDLVSLYDGKQNNYNINRILSLLDGKKQFRRFSIMDSSELKFFFDRESKNDLDVTLQLSNESTFESDAVKRLKAAKNNSKKLPLQGLKIALDPGHMSTKEWDKRTGKYVHDKKGNIISEGLINLQTCLVLKEEFEKLGAIVMVTREDHNPISKISLQNLDVADYGRKYLKNNSLSPWFLNLLATAPVGPALFKNFEASTDFQKLFKETARENYFIKGADLQARVDKIEEFSPDISLIIHYDSHDPADDPNGMNTKKYSRVKTYVHGSVDPEEWSGAKERSYVLHHIMDSTSYDFSKILSEEVVNGLKNGLKLGYDVTGAGSSYQVSPGVFARNLFITKKLYGHAHTYVECLHYNDPTEFKALLKKDFIMKIDGKPTYYSKRLRDVAFSIRNGVLNFMTKI